MPSPLIRRPWSAATTAVSYCLTLLMLIASACTSSPPLTSDCSRPNPPPALSAAPRTARPSSALIPQHLVLARGLLHDLPPDANTYQHSPTLVRFPTPGQPGQLRADCSGFFNELFKHSAGYTQSELQLWLGSRRPLARHYHDAIVRQDRFQPVPSVAALLPGDVITIRYERGASNSGHCMLVNDIPQPAPLPTPLPVGATRAFVVPVLDASSTGHGPGDSRWNDHARINTGLGTGSLRLFTDDSGVVRAHAFTTLPDAAVFTIAQRSVVLGRFTGVPRRSARPRLWRTPPARTSRRACSRLNSSAHPLAGHQTVATPLA